MFSNNVGRVDRGIRIILGIVLLGLIAVFPDTPWRWLGLIGLVPLVTGIFGVCLIYMPFGISTADRD